MEKQLDLFWNFLPDGTIDPETQPEQIPVAEPGQFGFTTLAYKNHIYLSVYIDGRYELRRFRGLDYSKPTR